MGRDPQVPEWPRWFRLLCYGFLAVIVLGMTARTLVDASSTRDAVRGLGGIALMCLWLGYRYVSKTRWRDRDHLSGLALLGCLVITVGALAVLAPDQRWLDREFLVIIVAAVLFALALVASPSVSLSARTFGVLVSAAGLGIVGVGLGVGLPSDGSGTVARSDTVVTGGICLLIGLLYVFKPDAMERFETDSSIGDGRK